MTDLNKSSKKSTKSSQELTFEEQMRRLEEIVEILDDGEASLDEMLLLYEEGMKRSQYCREYLERAEQKITLIQSQNSF
ncbi:exodeoxyribonuclease VII small subunit [Pseudanabaena mucicola]|uniref:Exodeoxyribonuclease 7 small subunit n=1 Tax=Pseudanabaena mucicola FACHB-723 TaxID=2692860 RepID=A0ABR7ZYG5_9CYAN|nr:exodeoxyribonuclease VII small subunit [Pseudanabaena mucicola]MBD2188993.1 exodeoxyribonuclease VII small subunit [Pseudanabaena mucicola FACHB-723]